jgi:hypothetical protein
MELNSEKLLQLLLLCLQLLSKGQCFSAGIIIEQSKKSCIADLVKTENIYISKILRRSA